MKIENTHKAILILVLAILIVVILLANKQPKSFEEFINSKKEVSYKTFVERLNNADSICVLEDFSAANQKQFRSIAQCGVDLVYSWTLYTNKSSYVYAINDSVCLTDKGRLGEESCIRDVMAKNCVIFYVIPNQNNTPLKTLDGLMVISVGEVYKEGDCSIIAHKS